MGSEGAHSGRRRHGLERAAEPSRRPVPPASRNSIPPIPPIPRPAGSPARRAGLRRGAGTRAATRSPLATQIPEDPEHFWENEPPSRGWPGRESEGSARPGFRIRATRFPGSIRNASFRTPFPALPPVPARTTRPLPRFARGPLVRHGTTRPGPDPPPGRRPTETRRSRRTERGRRTPTYRDVADAPRPFPRGSDFALFVSSWFNGLPRHPRPGIGVRTRGLMSVLAGP